MTRVKIIVMSVHSRPFKGRFMQSDDAIRIEDRDIFYGFVNETQAKGNHLDLWLTPIKEQDSRNYIAFGKVARIEMPYYGTGRIVATKMGRFYMEALHD